MSFTPFVTGEIGPYGAIKRGPLLNFARGSSIHPDQRIFSFGLGHHQVRKHPQPSCDGGGGGGGMKRTDKCSSGKGFTDSHNPGKKRLKKNNTTTTLQFFYVILTLQALPVLFRGRSQGPSFPASPLYHCAPVLP